MLLVCSRSGWLQQNCKRRANNLTALLVGRGHGCVDDQDQASQVEEITMLYSLETTWD